jgi:tetratricopeptide (TPR) repeat protein
MKIWGRKRQFYILGGTIGLIIIVFAARAILGTTLANRIPERPDFQNVALSLKEQIIQADQRAHSKPNAANLGLLGVVYHSAMYYDKAAVCYELAITKNRNEWLWSYYLGSLKREMGESDSAIKHFKTVTDINPGMYLARYYLGDLYQSLGRYAEAESSFAVIPGVSNIDSSDGNKSENGDFPLGAYAKFQLSRIYLNSQRLILAEKTLNEVIQSDRAFGPAYRLLGNIYQMKGDSARGQEFLVQSKDLTDNSVPVDKLIDGITLISRSDQYLLKQIDEAQKKAHPAFALVIADHGLKYLPDNKYIISKSVKLLLRMNYGTKVLPYLDGHLKFFMDDFTEIKEVADLLYGRGLYSQALIYFKRASELIPEDIEVKSSQVLCLWHDGKKDLALKYMNSLVLDDRDNLKILTDGVYVMLVAGEKETARSYLSRLEKKAPSNPRVLLMEGIVKESDGNFPGALIMYRSSFKANPGDMAVIQALGSCLLRLKMWEAALDHYHKSLTFFPNEPYLLEKLGSLLITCPDKKLRNIEEGKWLSERVFIHKACTPDLTIASGKSIAKAYASEGDFERANTYIEWILNVAQTQKAPEQIVAELENLRKEYSQK